MSPLTVCHRSTAGPSKVSHTPCHGHRRRPGLTRGRAPEGRAGHREAGRSRGQGGEQRCHFHRRCQDGAQGELSVRRTFPGKLKANRTGGGEGSAHRSSNQDPHPPADASLPGRPAPGPGPSCSPWVTGGGAESKVTCEERGAETEPFSSPLFSRGMRNSSTNILTLSASTFGRF